MAHFLDPLAAIWFLMVLILAGSLWRRRWRSAVSLGVPVVLISLLGSSPLVDLLVTHSERPYLRSDVAHLPPADAVVALGSGSAESLHSLLGFRMSNAGMERYLTAVELARDAKARVVVLGGDEVSTLHSGQSQMVPVQNWIQEWQLAPGVVTNLGICANSHDEALHYAQLAAANKWKRTLLVTSALHMKRAEAAFGKQGVMVVPIGCDFHENGKPFRWVLFPSQDRFVLWSLYLHEKIGWWVYRWRGWI
jgi:uncharacterized SAM-binding protein YcdF (DUF218 family)